MANAENIVGSMRSDLTAVFEALQAHLPAVIEDKDDFITEEGVAFFNAWFDTVGGYDIEFSDLADAVTAAETLLATWETVRAKFQVVRTR